MTRDDMRSCGTTLASWAKQEWASVRTSRAARRGCSRRWLWRNRMSRISKIGMVEDIKEFGTKLDVHSLSQMPVLGQREIEVPETGVREHVPAHVSELAQGRRNHDGISLGVSTQKDSKRPSTVQRFCRPMPTRWQRTMSWLRQKSTEFRLVPTLKSEGEP